MRCRWRMAHFCDESWSAPLREPGCAELAKEFHVEEVKGAQKSAEAVGTQAEKKTGAVVSYGEFGAVFSRGLEK